MCASENGRVPAVRLLLSAGADACAADTDGWTPLAFAARGGHLPVVQELIDAGAQIDSRDCVSRGILNAASKCYLYILSYLEYKITESLIKHCLLPFAKFLYICVYYNDY